MKKIIVIVSLVVVVASFLATASFVYAQNQNPSDEPYPGWMRNGRGRMGRGMMGLGAASGSMYAMHDIMHGNMVAALAEKLGLSVDEINQRLANGETMWDIAGEAGLTQEEFSAWMLETRKASLEEAVAQGVITQEQADWMLERMAQMQSRGFGPGSCHRNGYNPDNTGADTY